MKEKIKSWNWIVGLFIDVLVVISIFTVINKKDIKCRIYENEYETWVPDLNGNIQRKENKTIVINYLRKLG